MLPVVIAAVVLFVLAQREGIFATPTDALGIGPGPGGPNGPPPADWTGLPVPPQSSGGMKGDSVQNVTHGLEGLTGGVAGAAVCTYYGAGAAAPACAKVGSLLGPKAVQLGNYTTLKSLGIAKKTTDASFTLAERTTNAGGQIAAKGANIADTVYRNTDSLPTPLAIGAKASLLPIKITADAGAAGAALASRGVGALSSGAKASTHAVVSTAKKVLGWL